MNCMMAMTREDRKETVVASALNSCWNLSNIMPKDLIITPDMIKNVINPPGCSVIILLIYYISYNII